MIKSGLVLFGAAVLTSAPAAAQSGPPSEATIRQLIIGMYEPGGNKPDSHVDVTFVQIGAGFRANAGMASRWETDLNEIVYPVRVRYSLVNGTGPSAYVRDWDTHYVAFISRVKMGQWDLSNASVAGDKNGDLRGAGSAG